MEVKKEVTHNDIKKEKDKIKIKQCIKLKNGYLINIGPGWIVFFMLSIIFVLFGVSSLYFNWNYIKKSMTIPFIILIIALVIVTIYMTVSDPGIIQNRKHIYTTQFKQEVIVSELINIKNQVVNSDTEEKSEGNDENSIDKYSCTKCWAFIEEKATHCNHCKVCIKGWDHHCGYIGKCIGSKNFIGFYLYVIIAVIYAFYAIILFFIRAYTTLNSNEKKHDNNYNYN